MVRYMALGEEEKKLLVEITQTLVNEAEKARREGILALEENLEAISCAVGGIYGPFIEKLLYYVLCGIDPDIITSFANNFTESSCESDFERFCFEVIKNGVLSIQRGNSPNIIRELFVSYVGLQGESDFRARTGFEEKDIW